jgi:hypothetical protein
MPHGDLHGDSKPLVTPDSEEQEEKPKSKPKSKATNGKKANGAAGKAKKVSTVDDTSCVRLLVYLIPLSSSCRRRSKLKTWRTMTMIGCRISRRKSSSLPVQNSERCVAGRSPRWWAAKEGFRTERFPLGRYFQAPASKGASKKTVKVSAMRRILVGFDDDVDLAVC